MQLDTPGMHAGVPRVFDRIHNGVITKLEEKGGLAAKLFHWGYSIKSKKLQKNVRQDKVRLRAVDSDSCSALAGQ